MAVTRHPLHPELHFGRRHAELVLQDAARPQRRGLLIFRYPDPAALEIGGLLDAAIAPHHDVDMKETPRREYRKPDPAIIVAGARHHQRGERHFGDIEIRKTK